MYARRVAAIDVSVGFHCRQEIVIDYVPRGIALSSIMMYAQIIDEPIEKLFNWVIAVLLLSHCSCARLRKEEKEKKGRREMKEILNLIRKNFDKVSKNVAI